MRRYLRAQPESLLALAVEGRTSVELLKVRHRWQSLWGGPLDGETLHPAGGEAGLDPVIFVKTSPAGELLLYGGAEPGLWEKGTLGMYVRDRIGRYRWYQAGEVAP